MIFRGSILGVALAMSISCGFAASVKNLTAAEMAQATKVESLTIPTPGELMAALNKVGKPNWQGEYRQPIPTTFTSRPQIALNLGGLIADGYLAVEAEDSQQVKNIGKDIITLARALAVSENVMSRGKSITDFAETNDWSALKEELEATQNEVKIAMNGQHDQDLVTLVTLGGWIRGTEVVSSWIADNYSAPAAKLLRQPATVSFLRAKIDSLPEKVRSEEVVKNVEKKLADIEQEVSFPRDQTPTLDAVKTLKATAGDLEKSIMQK